MNHVFVDFENVHEVDPALFGAKSVSLTLLLGARQTKLDAALVEKLLEHAASVQLVRLTSSGKNAGGLSPSTTFTVNGRAATTPGTPTSSAAWRSSDGAAASAEPSAARFLNTTPMSAGIRMQTRCSRAGE